MKATTAAGRLRRAHRVLMDVGQVLNSFHDTIVAVGGWVPDLLLPDARPEHVGSIDVDLALDAAKLNDGRYADLLKLLLDTQRYKPGDKLFQYCSNIRMTARDRMSPANHLMKH